MNNGNGITETNAGIKEYGKDHALTISKINENNNGGSVGHVQSYPPAGKIRKRKNDTEGFSTLGNRSQCDNFLHQLMDTLADESIGEIINVHPIDCNSFEIRQPSLFLEKVLPYRFGLRKLGAFENRLKKHGFQMTSSKLSKLELCGFKAPHKVARRSPPVDSPVPSSEDVTCSITYRHPVIQMDSWASFYSTEQSWKQNHRQDDVSGLKSNTSNESSSLEIAAKRLNVLKSAYDTLDNDTLMREAGILKGGHENDQRSS